MGFQGAKPPPQMSAKWISLRNIDLRRVPRESDEKQNGLQTYIATDNHDHNSKRRTRRIYVGNHRKMYGIINMHIYIYIYIYIATIGNPVQKSWYNSIHI